MKTTLTQVCSPDLVAMGFTGTREVEYLGPSQRPGRHASKPIGRFPGYSQVRDVLSGEVKNVRNDLLMVVTR